MSVFLVLFTVSFLQSSLALPRQQFYPEIYEKSNRDTTANPNPVPLTSTPVTTPFSTEDAHEESKSVEKKPISETLLEISNRTIENFNLEFRKMKSRLSLDTLEQVIPVAENIRMNLSEVLLEDSEMGQNLTAFNLVEKEVDREMQGIEKNLNDNREAVGKLDQILSKTEEELLEFNGQLGDILRTRFPNSSADDFPNNQEMIQDCGGLINVDEQSTLTKVVDGRRTCMWILWSQRTTSMRLEWKNFIDPILVPHLTVHSNFTGQNPQTYKLGELLDQSVELSGPVILVQSKFSRNSRQRPVSFNIELTNSGVRQQQQHQVAYHPFKTIALDAGAVEELRYPFTGGNYRDFERTFFSLLPGRGTALSVRVFKIDMESIECDYLSIFRFNPLSGSLEYMAKESGHDRSGLIGTYLGFSDEPMLLYFHSDRSATRTGFELLYTSV